MVDLRIAVKSGNAAFEEAPVEELRRILQNVMDRLDTIDGAAPIRDINGNTVGEVFLVLGNEE